MNSWFSGQPVDAAQKDARNLGPMPKQSPPPNQGRALGNCLNYRCNVRASLNGGQLGGGAFAMANTFNRCGVIRSFENSGASDDGIGSSFQDLPGVIDL